MATLVPFTRCLGALAIAIALLATATPAEAAQSNETGEDNEFGSIRMPYQVEMSGETLTLQSKVLLGNYYGEQDTTYFMFAWSTENMPALKAQYVSLETAAGDPIKIYERQDEGDLIKWFVDVKDMPPVGTEIVMTGKVDSSSRGFFSAATLVVPFTYRWEKVTMSNGNEAKLYAFTQVGVNQESVEGGGSKFGRPGGGKLPIPGVPLALAAVGLALAAAASQRTRRPRA